MIAEGGTEHFHSETIARSENIRGPYESYRGNPILTQRHLGMKAAIANTGHADLVELKDGSWYMVFLLPGPMEAIIKIWEGKPLLHLWNGKRAGLLSVLVQAGLNFLIRGRIFLNFRWQRSR